MTFEEAQQRIAAIRSAGGEATTEEVDELWAALPPVSPEEILGLWHGSELRTGHSFEGQLEAARWYGKRFDSLTEVAPIVCQDESGELFDNTKMAGGAASLWSVRFRGEVTATMVYDSRPVFDHFKAIDDKTLLGVMNGKGVLHEGRHYYFVLERS